MFGFCRNHRKPVDGLILGFTQNPNFFTDTESPISRETETETQPCRDVSVGRCHVARHCVTLRWRSRHQCVMSSDVIIAHCAE